MPSDQLEEERDEFSDEKELTGGVVVVYGSSLFNEVYRLGLQILIFIYHGFPLLMNGGVGVVKGKRRSGVTLGWLARRFSTRRAKPQEANKIALDFHKI